MVMPVPGAIGDITGTGGEVFAVQSLWSNASAGGAGYCAGIASTDLPAPLAGEPPYASATLLGASKKAVAGGRAAKRARRTRRHAKRHKVRYRVV
jgi:hypothetical protein